MACCASVCDGLLYAPYWLYNWLNAIPNLIYIAHTSGRHLPNWDSQGTQLIVFCRCVLLTCQLSLCCPHPCHACTPDPRHMAARNALEYSLNCFGQSMLYARRSLWEIIAPNEYLITWLIYECLHSVSAKLLPLKRAKATFLRIICLI